MADYLWGQFRKFGWARIFISEQHRYTIISEGTKLQKDERKIRHYGQVSTITFKGDYGDVLQWGFLSFATDELIQWIELLFADTPLRRNAIDDIYEIRGTALDD